MHLNRFVDKNGDLHIWNKRAGKILKQKPANAFGETHLNTVETSTGNKDTWFEKELSQLEGDVNPILKAIEAEALLGRAYDLPQNDRDIIDKFFVMSWKRVPDFHRKAPTISEETEALDQIFDEVRRRHPDQIAKVNSLDTPESRARLLQAGKIQGLAAKGGKIPEILAQGGLGSGLIASK